MKNKRFSGRLRLSLGCCPVLALVAAALPSAAAATPTFYAGTGNHYEFVQGSFSWTYALTLASQMTFEGRQGHLVTITSAGEDEFVRSLYDGFAWGAASDAGDEGNFTWRAGPEMGQALTYAAWNPGEPNNAWNDEHYLNMTSHNGWNDVPNGYGLSFVVEYEAAAVPEPLSWAMMICGFGLIGGTLRRREKVITFC